MYSPKALQENIRDEQLAERSRAKGKLRCSVDLKGHLSVCEINYQRLLKLLPGLRSDASAWHFRAGSLSTGSHNNAPECHSNHFDVTIKVIDEAPYTTTLSIEQQHQLIDTPTITVRLYHDADLAEIISWDGHRNWRPQYEYPNINMYQPDEKMALNRFLAEWLNFCQKNGFVAEVNCDQIRFSAK